MIVTLIPATAQLPAGIAKLCIFAVTPVPDSATTAVLVGFVLVGIGLFYRKFKNPKQ